MTNAAGMTRERWSRITVLFQAAVEDPERFDSRWLSEACAEDTDLLNQVLRLVENDRALSARRQDDVDGPFHQVPSDKRFQYQCAIGSGGFGDVYMAFDRRRQEQVAIKLLRAPGADALRRFKQESRITRINHPNLVRIHELVCEGSDWLIVMELLDGSNVVSALADLPVAERFRQVPGIMTQIALGLGTLHVRNILHRDIKPSNVWMTSEGRVVLLDFGLAKTMAGSNDEISRDLIGAPDYVSPEQVGGHVLTEATDWYGVGVILYHILTGRRPFEGDARAVLRAKTESDPVHPCCVNDVIPRQLGDLCVGLLDRNPATRFGSSQILATDPLARESESIAVAGRPQKLIGRSSELRQLDRAWKQVVDGPGKPIAVCVIGESGIGKSELVQSFLESVANASPYTVILRGRCYEAESVPYKAFDALLDALAGEMKRFDPALLDAILPRDIDALSQVFPVFHRVDSLKVAKRTPVSDDPAGQRSAGFGALRELLARLALRRNVVMFIDDLHLGDSESGELMASLLSGRDAPCMLWLFAWPANQSEAALPTLLRKHSGWDVEVRTIDLRPLEESDGVLLTKRLLPDALEETIAWVAREGRNIPFFLQELAALARRAPIPAKHITAESAVISRVNDLDHRARSILRVIALADGPLAEEVIRSAANISEGFHQSRDNLIDFRLIRVTSGGSLTGLDIYHARQRMVLASGVWRNDAVSLHRRIANALEETGTADPEHIYSYLAKAGENGRAAIYAERAGDQAASQLAFDRAVRLFLAASEMQSDAPSSASLLRKLGNARAGAGLGEQAAEAYMQAASADPGSALDLQILATEQLLRSGSVEAGLKALKDVSRRAGVPWSGTRIGLYGAVAVLRARLWLGGRNGWQPRRAKRRNSTRLLDQIRICWIGTIGTSMSDPIRSAEYSTRHLLLALRLGDFGHLCRAFAAEAAHSVAEVHRVALPREFIAEAKRMSRGIEDVSAEAFLAFMEGIVACNDGKWQDCIDLCHRALDLYRKSTSGIGWDRTTAASFILSSRILLGDWTTAAHDLPVLVREAEGRGDRYAAVNLPLLTSSYLPLLAQNKPAEARQQVHLLLDRWGQHRFDLQKFYTFVADIDTFLYEGKSFEALTELRTTWSRLRRAGMLRLPMMRILSHYLAAKCCIANACLHSHGRGRARLLSEARTFSLKLASEPHLYATGTAAALRAAISAAEGNVNDTETLLQEAEAQLNRAELFPWAAACRAHRTGRYVDDYWFRRENVVDAPRLANTLLPGNWL